MMTPNFIEVPRVRDRLSLTRENGTAGCIRWFGHSQPRHPTRRKLRQMGTHPRWGRATLGLVGRLEVAVAAGRADLLVQGLGSTCRRTLYFPCQRRLESIS